MVIRIHGILFVLCLVPALRISASATSDGSPTLPTDLPGLESRLALEPNNVKILVRVALEYHNEAALGGNLASARLKKARTYLEFALQHEPTNAFVRTLLGSAIIMSAREPLWFGTKLRRVREGIALMDAAINDDPNDPDARFTRASNNVFLPERFKRRDVTRTDFEWLQTRADRGEFAPDFRQYVYLYHGFAHHRWGDERRARELWEAGLAINPRSKAADELRSELSGKSELSRLDGN
jgi:tetratricopeptide (TPR) repeat protein